jgi:mono/diheme cytochrome c family protein
MPPTAAVLVRIGAVVALYAGYTLALAVLPEDRDVAPADPVRYAAGRDVWLANRCQSCHSIYGLGGHLGPDLTSVLADPDATESVLLTLRYGRGQMPGFGLGDAKEDALLDFLRVVGSTGRYPPRSLGDDVFGGPR